MLSVKNKQNQNSHLEKTQIFTMDEIRNLDELLAPKLGPHRKIINVDVIKPPPNQIGCVMLKIKVFVQDQDGKEEVIHLVAKKIPDTEFSRNMYDVQVTFRKEVSFYEVILPIFLEFQKEEGVTDVMDNFAEFYGARYNLQGNSDVVDEDAVMLLEDLTVKGFGHSNLEKGINLNLAKQILQDLAKFHGTMIALKFKKPDIFEKKIRSHCAPFSFAKDDLTFAIFDTLKKLISTFPEHAHLAEKATNFPIKNTPKTFREPFATLIHFDVWVNNVMNRMENDGSIKNIFVDFQLYDYRSPVSDVFFFLWTSVQKEVLEEHLDSLLNHYHQNLLKVLNGFRIDTSNFGYEHFQKELQIESEFEFGHALLFIFYLKIVTIQQETENVKIDEDDISPELKEMIHFMVAECDRRGWLY